MVILFMVVSASLSFSQCSVASENCKSQGDFNNSRINVGATCKQPAERGSGGSKEPPKIISDYFNLCDVGSEGCR
ncbi:MAG: hypothetical protein ACRD3Q_05635, partial [Terriglobales bacterium]